MISNASTLSKQIQSSKTTDPRLESENPIILSLETATLAGSVWLGRNHQTLAAKDGDAGISQSVSLLTDINTCLQEARLSLAQVNLFACASGPGSFTGLRIGIATLKGLAATLDRPAAGVPTLQAVAHAAGPSTATVALLPAGRGEVFAQMFSAATIDGELSVIPGDSPAHLTPEKMLERYQGIKEILWSGSGAHLYRNAIEKAATTHGSGWTFAREETNLARHVAALANQAYRSGKVKDQHSLNAIYVRPSDAELKELQG